MGPSTVWAGGGEILTDFFIFFVFLAPAGLAFATFFPAFLFATFFAFDFRVGERFDFVSFTAFFVLAFTLALVALRAISHIPFFTVAVDCPSVRYENALARLRQ
jgi:hypothetical protein